VEPYLMLEKRGHSRHHARPPFRHVCRGSLASGVLCAVAGGARVTWLGLVVVTVDEGDLAAECAGLEALRRGLGARLAVYRRGAGISQPELGQAIGRTR
jgi:hypothetical protein